MWVHTVKIRLALENERIARLDQVRGATLRVRCGTAWITIDNDRRDIVLEAGDRFVIDTAQPVLLQSLGGEAVVDVLEPMRGRPAHSRPGWAARLGTALRSGPGRGFLARMA